MSSRSTIRDILPPEGRQSRRPPRRLQETDQDIFSDKRDPHLKGISRRRRVPWLYGLVLIGALIIILFFLFSFLFTGAQVVTFPKYEKVVVNGDFTASTDVALSSLPYDIMTLELTESQSVVATGREEVSLKASGKIVIYNNYNTAIQRLIRNTRFETPLGLIYRINESIVVPGQTSEGGKVTPGSIEVTVYADEPGEAYNVGLTDFTVPGFKGAPQFEYFYARSKFPMTGGFVGEQLVVEESVQESAREELRVTLNEQLLLEAFSQVPEGFLLFEDAVFVEFESQPTIEQDGSVVLTEKAILFGVLFEEKAFARHLAQNTLAGFDDSPVELKSLESLSLTVLDKENMSPWEKDIFTFSLSGNATLVWLFDEAKLKDDLAGRDKRAIYTILSGYPSIERAEVIIRPFWRQSFPDAIEDITIERNLED
ncbi:hypothetical protein IIC45_01365 [Patescibacteria group bacterium]|nr:hypothetical protein [Patescibacteria group bacterium]